MCIRDFFLSLAFFLILAFDGSGQDANTTSPQQAISYRTAFYNFYFTNPDSALYYAQKMAAEPSYKSYLREMIHKDFYGMFHETIKEKIGEGAKKQDPAVGKGISEVLWDHLQYAYKNGSG